LGPGGSTPENNLEEHVRRFRVFDLNQIVIIGASQKQSDWLDLLRPPLLGCGILYISQQSFSDHVFAFSPVPRFCWENAALLSNKSVNVDTTKVLMASHSRREGDDHSKTIYTMR
jgi:hypothetical protein